MYELIKKLDFVRLSGTEDEARAARIIAAECTSFSLDAGIETFPTQDGEVLETYLEVLEPYRKVYEAVAHRRSACLDAEVGIEYAEDGLDVNLAGCAGKAILLNTGITKQKYPALVKAKPACVIVGNGDLLDRDEDTDLIGGMLRPSVTDSCEERLCALTVRMRDLYEMIVKGASRAKIKLVTRDFENTSRNVTACIKGTEYPDEIITFTAHMDSVQFSHGCYDNAAGSAIIMELARHFTQNPPARTLRFVWAGSEERGLLGSKAFVKAHDEEIKNTRLCINVDLAGSPAGRDFAIVTGPDELSKHIDMSMKENGFAVEVKCDTYSSDCIPFADAGVPAVSMGRFGAPGMSYIHSRRDKLDYVSAASLARTGKMIKLFAERMANARVLPVERKIPDDIKKKIADYLAKK
ncbi:MAG: M28 family peptidase [Clostridia bacterium]|nr:M28 family peptidase [Clostridia bacterium]